MRHGIYGAPVVLGVLSWATQAWAGPLQAAASPADRDLLNVSYYCRIYDAMDALDAGANINAQDEEGQTPLLQATSGACDELVDMLIEKGADVSATNGKGQTALDVAKEFRMANIIESLERAEAGGGPGDQAKAVDGAVDPLAAAVQLIGGDAGSTGFVPWPAFGTYVRGQKVIMTWAPAGAWDFGVVVDIDRSHNNYVVKDKFDSIMPFNNSEVAAPIREPYWTGWFVGDWKVSIPLSLTTTTEGSQKFETLNGGMNLPPLRIGADGTYVWQIHENGADKVLKGSWVARPDAPGVILKNADQGVDWVVYNSTDNVVDYDEIHLYTEKYTYYTATRIDDGQ